MVDPLPHDVQAVQELLVVLYVTELPFDLAIPLERPIRRRGDNQMH
jgi:hypothetical protein